MKTIILCLTLISLAVAQTPVMRKDRQVLFDFRSEDEASSARITAATQRMVLSKVFRKYLTDANRCNFQGAAGDDYLAAARKAGQVVPSISDVETGSFTAPGQTQTLYVIDVAGGDKVPRKGGPGITQSDLLVINKTDLAPHVGADLGVMERDAKKMRGSGPTVFAQVTKHIGVSDVVSHILHARAHALGLDH